MSERATAHNSPACTIDDAQPGVEGGFYERALPTAERAIYCRARQARGLEDEIAILRLKLFALLIPNENGDEAARMPAIARLIDLLIKALRAEGTGGHDDRLLGNLLDEESARILAAARKK